MLCPLCSSGLVRQSAKKKRKKSGALLLLMYLKWHISGINSPLICWVHRLLLKHYNPINKTYSDSTSLSYYNLMLFHRWGLSASAKVGGLDVIVHTLKCTNPLLWPLQLRPQSNNKSGMHWHSLMSTLSQGKSKKKKMQTCRYGCQQNKQGLKIRNVEGPHWSSMRNNGVFLLKNIYFC